jgi:hypothetical protein
MRINFGIEEKKRIFAFLFFKEIFMINCFHEHVIKVLFPKEKHSIKTYMIILYRQNRVTTVCSSLFLVFFSSFFSFLLFFFFFTSPYKVYERLENGTNFFI